ncbi:hypothetical protein [Nocardia sp. XZ_19_369]|uniref:hypothetical protein n=1 Tax=Nocardia sp. XZ_19_369 TaxID=2769487 RepID=UPI00188F962B|nr:hypothetical protein [Nocardia sp. XZ_19_369]
MPRQVEFDVALTTTQFSPFQLRPRILLELMSEGFARSMVTHIVPFRELLIEHRTAVVVQLASIDYRAPDLRFDEAEWLTTRASLRTSPTGDRLCMNIHFHAGSREVAQGALILRVVRLADADSFAARPGVLPEEVRARFTDEDVHNQDLRQALQDTAADMPTGTPDLLREWRTLLCRSHCEVADQWSFIEMIELATQARERLSDDAAGGSSTRQLVMVAPLRALRALFRRPMFVLDECAIVTSVHTRGNGAGVTCRHEVGQPGHIGTHLTVWEQLGEPTH